MIMICQVSGRQKKHILDKNNESPVYLSISWENPEILPSSFDASLLPYDKWYFPAVHFYSSKLILASLKKFSGIM